MCSKQFGDFGTGFADFLKIKFQIPCIVKNSVEPGKRFAPVAGNDIDWCFASIVLRFDGRAAIEEQFHQFGSAEKRGGMEWSVSVATGVGHTRSPIEQKFENLQFAAKSCVDQWDRASIRVASIQGCAVLNESFGFSNVSLGNRFSKRSAIPVRGSYLNRTTLSYDYDRAVLLGRARKNARLCYPAPEGGRRVYGEYKFTPEQVSKDKRRKWKRTHIFHGGKWREVRYKEVPKVLWQGGGRRRLLRLIVVAPVAYRNTKGGRKYYRQKAYLLCTDHDLPAKTLLQKYFDRWQIEYNHRDEKDILGVGQAQVWSELSTPRVPAFIVSVYSQILVSALILYGPKRTDDYLPLPCWRKPSKRPSCQDLVNLLRKEHMEQPCLLSNYIGGRSDTEKMCLSAAA